MQGLTQYVTQPLSTLFLSLIFMMIVPLLFSALVVGVSEMGDVKSLGRIGWMPDLLALVIVFWGVHQPARVSIGIAFMFGLAMDVQQSALLGQHALSYTTLGFMATMIHRRPILWAVAAVVPEPANRSATRSPGLVPMCRIRSRSVSGFGVSKTVSASGNNAAKCLFASSLVPTSLPPQIVPGTWSASMSKFFIRGCPAPPFVHQIRSSWRRRLKTGSVANQERPRGGRSS